MRRVIESNMCHGIKCKMNCIFTKNKITMNTTPVKAWFQKYVFIEQWSSNTFLWENKS